jgi:hypothetical protein
MEHFRTSEWATFRGILKRYLRKLLNISFIPEKKGKYPLIHQGQSSEYFSEQQYLREYAAAVKAKNFLRQLLRLLIPFRQEVFFLLSYYGFFISEFHERLLLFFSRLSFGYHGEVTSSFFGLSDFLFQIFNCKGLCYTVFNSGKL